MALFAPCSGKALPLPFPASDFLPADYSPIPSIVMYMRVVAVVLTVLMLAYPASAWTGDDYTDEDWDARILRALDDSKTWGMVLSEVDTWTADEMWGLVESIDIPPVSQSTWAAIRDKLAIDNRIPDSRFTGMPTASDAWLIRLIVVVVVTVILIAVGYVASPYMSSVSSTVSVEEAASVEISASELMERLTFVSSSSS